MSLKITELLIEASITILKVIIETRLVGIHKMFTSFLRSHLERLPLAKVIYKNCKTFYSEDGVQYPDHELLDANVYENSLKFHRSFQIYSK